MSKTKQDWKCLFGYHQWGKWHNDGRIANLYNSRDCENCGAEQVSTRDLEFLNRVTASPKRPVEGADNE